jgi:hypothetical protein
MRLLHHSDDDKEFCSYDDDPYDTGMLPVPLALLLNPMPAERLWPLPANVIMRTAAIRRFLFAFILVLAVDRVAFAQAPVHLTLAFAPESALPPGVVRAASAEAADIWAAYGVAVDLAAPCGLAPDHPETLTVMIKKSSPSTEPWHGTLGTIGFDADGVPHPSMTVYFDRLIELISTAPTWTANERQWPRALRQQIIGRALGRIIAHEIGHFVLRSRDHASSGLMRRVQASDDLIAPDRSRFALWRPAASAVTR